MTGATVGSGVGLQPGRNAGLRHSGRDRAGEQRQCALFLVVLACALAAVGVSVVVAKIGAVPADSVMLLLAVAAIAVALGARIRVRVGTTYLLVAWGEFGALIALCLLPPIWVPVAGALGALLAYLDRIRAVIAGRRRRALFPIVSITVAIAASAGTVMVITGDVTQPVRAGLARPVGLAGVLLAALVFTGVASLLTAAWVTGEGGLVAAWRQALFSKRMMVVGNITLGLGAAVILSVQPWWLLALAPVVVILHRAYVYQARSTEQRHTWAALAQATRSLNQLDEHGVVTAARQGALSLFDAASVEVRLHGVGPVGATPPGTHVVTRALVVGDEELGELRLAFHRPTLLDQSALLVLAAFADAVAAALHDATVHRRLRVMTARSAFDAIHDPLTGLANRSMLIAHGDAELRRRPVGAQVALVLLDVDGFREVNDALGHGAGDELLCALARRLSDAARPGELLACLGGDEFAVLLAEPGPDGAEPQARAEQIADLACLPAEVTGVTIAVAATAGIGLGTVGRVTVTELLRRADLALRRARREGSRTARSDTAHSGHSHDRPALLADLRDALATTGQLQLLFQPVVDMTTGAPVGAEALVRWHHPTRGLLLPADFIELIEQSELSTGFTRYVLDLALEVAAGWATQGVPLPISVNLCARCTLDPGLPELVAACLAAHDVPPDRLILEVTEGVMAADLEQAERAIASLREVGVQVSVGDFGAALASLQFLARCPVDEVKIHRDFVAEMIESPETAAIVQATLELGRELGLRVVAEGVERPEQRDALGALGVSAVQGYLFYPPMPPVQTTTVLQGLAVAATARQIANRPAPDR